MSDDSGSDSEAWTPTVVRKAKKGVRVLDDTDDDVEQALVESTSEEEEEENKNADESTDIIIGSSGDEAEEDSDSYKTAGEGDEVLVLGGSYRSVGRSSDGSEHSNRSRETLEATSDEHAELSNSSHESLPGTGLFDEPIERANRSQEKESDTLSKSKDRPLTAMAPLKPTATSTNRIKDATSTFVDVEDELVADLNNITLKGATQFAFKKKENEKKTNDHEALGATCGGFFEDEEEEDDEEISANFDFDSLQDSGNGDPDIQVLRDDNHRKPKKTGSGPMIDLTNSDTDDLSILADQLSLGTNAPKKDPPRRTIFLDTVPPPEKKTYSYDPTNVKHQEFYGDVQRTIAQIAHTIENMPTTEDTEDDIVLPKGLVALFDHQLYGLRWLSWREREFPGGGILADEMGLGKTIMVIALIMKSKMEGNAAGSNEENWIDTEEIGRCIPSKTTLVVCPVGCLGQWSDEISSKGKGLRVNVFHGPKRTTSAAQLAQYDVVLTTYSTISAEIPKDDTRGRSPLIRIYWKRIVLDEAHNIRNPKTAGAIAICKLSARHRWAVTGTPVHNRPEDFYSMAKFLRMKPFDDSKTWDFWIGLKQVRRASDAQQRLSILGKALILRRTKDEVQAAGGNVRKIPPKVVEVVELELSEAERRVNDYLMQYSKNMFKQFLEDKEQRTRELNGAAMTYTAERRKKKTQDQAPPDDIKFSHLFALLIRMRQCAVLPHLIETMLEEEEIDEDVSFDELRDDHIISKINPVFDRLYVSSKFKRILEDVEALRAQAYDEGRPMDKVVIVSSWTTTLDILNQHFSARRFSCIFITGREKTNDRTDNMKKFNKYPEKYQICLLSLMAGGVGLNLTGGNHVFFVEPHWNPQLELQAQDRVHRFGQTKNVTIKRYIAKETVEDRITALQNMKIDLADGVLNSTKMAKGGGLTIANLRTLFQ